MKLVKFAFAGVALIAASQTFAAEEVSTPAPATEVAASEVQATESAASEVQATEAPAAEAK